MTVRSVTYGICLLPPPPPAPPPETPYVTHLAGGGSCRTLAGQLSPPSCGTPPQPPTHLLECSSDTWDIAGCKVGYFGGTDAPVILNYRAYSTTDTLDNLKHAVLPAPGTVRTRRTQFYSRYHAGYFGGDGIRDTLRYSVISPVGTLGTRSTSSISEIRYLDTRIIVPPFISRPV